MFRWLCYAHILSQNLQNSKIPGMNHTHAHTQSAKLKNDVLHNLFISKPMCGTMDGIYLVWCNKLHEGKSCLPIQQRGDTHLWQQFRRGSCWCCAGLCRYRRRRRRHSTGRWGSTALLLHTHMNNRCRVHACNVILYAYRYTQFVYSDQLEQNFFLTVLQTKIKSAEIIREDVLQVCEVPCLRLSAPLEMGRPSSLDQ